jgi:hypothetical protein
MARKAKAPGSSRANRAAEQADFKAWLADAVATLQREHNANPTIIPVRKWRHLYIQGRSPQEIRLPSRRHSSGFVRVS